MANNIIIIECNIKPLRYLSVFGLGLGRASQPVGFFLKRCRQKCSPADIIIIYSNVANGFTCFTHSHARPPFINTRSKSYTTSDAKRYTPKGRLRKDRIGNRKK